MTTAFSKVTTKSQTVIPREVRAALGVRPGDRLRYVIDGKTVRVERVASAEEDDPFAVFVEWSGEADEKAYGKL